MTPEQSAAFVMAATIRAYIRATAMTAENFARQVAGESLAYNESAINAIIDDEGIGHNSVMEVLVAALNR